MNDKGIQNQNRQSPGPRHLDSPRPDPYRQTSAGVWETVTNQPVPRDKNLNSGKVVI